MKRSGLEIIRWTSSGSSGDTGAQAFTIMGPIVMLGDKMPVHHIDMDVVGPAVSIAFTSSPSLVKSADRMDGAIFPMGLILYDTVIPFLTTLQKNRPYDADAEAF